MVICTDWKKRSSSRYYKHDRLFCQRIIVLMSKDGWILDLFNVKPIEEPSQLLWDKSTVDARRNWSWAGNVQSLIEPLLALEANPCREIWSKDCMRDWVVVYLHPASCQSTKPLSTRTLCIMMAFHAYSPAPMNPSAPSALIRLIQHMESESEGFVDGCTNKAQTTRP